MSETKPSSPDLSSLSSDYEIVGEVGGSRHSRNFMATRKGAGAKRRGDQAGVLISIVSSPAGDEGNALSHLAADTKFLAGSTHRRLIPVIEGRWIGDDAFAVITQRTTDPSLAQKIVTGERFAATRVAAILREVNGLLEWAREHNVIHRTVTADRIYLEPRTDRVRISFGVAPILRIKQTDAPTEDARTIVRLAMAMLTGTEDTASYNGKTLAEMRPDLPLRLRDATDEMLDEKHSHTSADVNGYLALVGMADPILAGEAEATRIRAEILEEQTVEREKLATERAEFERVMAEERAAFERFMAEEREKYERHMAEEHTAYERQKEEERAKHANERGELQRVVTLERAALVTKRAELERIVKDQREEMERVASEDRRAIDALRARLKSAGELEIEKKRDAALEEVTDAESTLDREEFSTPLFAAPLIVPLEQLKFDDDTVLFEDTEEYKVRMEPTPPNVASTVRERERLAAVVGVPATRSRRMMLAGVAAIVVIVVASIALASRREPREAIASPPVKPPVVQAPVAIVPTSIVPLPDRPTIDSSAGNVSRPFDSAVAARLAAPTTPRPRPKKIEPDTEVVPDSLVGDTTTPVFRDVSPRKRDTLVPKKPDALPQRDSLARPDTM
ncbi:MAG: hypothetical protein ABI625_07975 [bacterium]